MVKNEANCSSPQESKIKTRRTRALAILPEQTVEWLRIPALVFVAVGTLGLCKALSFRAAGLLKPLNLPNEWICLALLCASAFLYALVTIARLKERIGTQNRRTDNPEKVGIKYRWRSC